MTTLFPGKRWIRFIQFMTVVSIIFSGSVVMLPLFTMGYFLPEMYIPLALIVVCIPLAIWQVWKINDAIYAYEHAYDHNDIALRLMAHANEVRASDEGRPTDQP